MGTTRQLMTYAVGEGWLLATVFAQQSQLGLVRVMAARAAEELRPLYEAARSRAANQTTAAPPGFRAKAADAIDQLFGEKR